MNRDGNWTTTCNAQRRVGGIPTHESGSHAFATRVMPRNVAMSHPYETSLVRWA